MSSAIDGKNTSPGRDLTRDQDSTGQNSVDQTVWKKFIDATSTKDFARYWLDLQCSFIDGVNRAVVVLGKEDSGPYKPTAYWPENEDVSFNLTVVAEMAMKERRGVVQIRNQNKDGNFDNHKYSHLAYPFLIEDSLYGVVAIEIAQQSEHQLRTVMRKLQWGCSWFEVLFRRDQRRTPLSDSSDIVTVLGLIASVIDVERFQAAANTAVTEMAIQLKCERVSLGFLKGKNIQLTALSHSAQFNKKSNFIRSIGAAMEEAVDQKSTLIYPPSSTSIPGVTRVHEKLAQEHNVGAICTVPLCSDERVYGALTFERSANHPVDQQLVGLCETIAQMIGPVMDTKRRDDRVIFVKIWQSFVDLIRRLFGARYFGLKLTALCLASVIVFFSLATTDYRVSANTWLEGAVQRVVVSPMNAYIAEAYVRAGDIVREGDLIVSLDDKDLRLEYLKWKSEQEKYLKQYRDALAKYKRAEISVLKAQLGQAQTQLELINEQLSRTRVVAPFDGIVVSGDLSQSLGAPVERGEILFEVAPLKDYRVILLVDERNISNISIGQQGELVLSGVVNEILPFLVEKITPVSEVKEGRNYFRVEARLIEVRDFLRPGMKGVGKISIGQRKLFWVLTHELIDWLHLKLWAWWL